jgi:predicted DNA-binding transcriptional regulator YafY
MRRADRLFHIVQLLRRHRHTTAAKLADRLEVSERTVYRDVRDLVATGVPIEGEAGVGYRLGKDFDLPPLMFSFEEVQALVLGARMVETWADDELRQAARRVLDKVQVVVPDDARRQMDDTALFALSFRVDDGTRATMRVLRRAVNERAVVALDYTDRDGTASERRVRPLGLYFWGPTWTLAAWCELRKAHRSFRLDRIANVTRTADRFEAEPPCTLQAYIESVSHDG